MPTPTRAYSSIILGNNGYFLIARDAPDIPKLSTLPHDKAVDLLSTGKYSDFKVHCGSKTFLVHKAILSSGSEFFRAAIDSGFKESSEGAIEIKETTPLAVATVIRSIYIGTSPQRPTVEVIWPGKFSSGETRRGKDVDGLLELYLLADHLMLDGLKRKAAKHFLNLLVVREDGEYS